MDIIPIELFYAGRWMGITGVTSLLVGSKILNVTNLKQICFVAPEVVPCRKLSSVLKLGDPDL